MTVRTSREETLTKTAPTGIESETPAIETDVEGSLGVFKFPEILQFVSSGKRSGVLTIARDDRTVELAFKEGRIINVSSSDRYIHLGQMLVYSGLLTRDALQKALKIQEQSAGEKFLGEILVEQGLANVEQLKSIIRLQLEEELWELFSWSSGTFRFEQSRTRKMGSVEVDLDVAPLHEQATRRTQEWQALYKSIKVRGDVFSVNPDFPQTLETPLDEKTWRVLSLVNGELNVEALVRLSNIGKFETYVALDHLLRNDLITGSNDGATEISDGSGEPANSEAPSPPTAPLQNGARLRLKTALPQTGTAQGWLSALIGRKSRVDSSPASSSESARKPVHNKKYFITDVGLACGAINSLLQELEGLHGFAARDGDWTAEIWSGAKQRFHRADVITLLNCRLDSSLFDRYAECERSITRPLAGTHSDALEALRLFWNKLGEKAEFLLGGEKEASHLLDRIAHHFDQAAAAICAPEFSFSRWKELGISPVNIRAAAHRAPAQ